MEPLSQDESEADFDAVDSLLLRCLESEPVERERVLADLCRSHAALAEPLRRRLRLLDEVGFLPPSGTTDASLPSVVPNAATGPLDRLGPFRILRRLGAGGMGVVYLAIQEPLERKVALKLLRPERKTSDTARERFTRECTLLSRLDHPGICPVYEVGEVDGQPYLAMRYLEGSTLADRIESVRQAADTEAHSRKWIAEVLALFEQLADAAHAAHQAGLVHRDLKPSNVMITTGGQPVILDFGLVRDEASEAGLTLSGDVLGTPAYLAPEQIDRQRADRRSDVYALGVTLYECVTLRRPFEAVSRESLYRQILTGDYSAPRLRNRQVPRDLAVAIATAMDRDPQRRYQTARALADDLRRMQRHEPIAARPTGRLLRTGRWMQRNPVLTLFLVFLIAGLGVTLALYTRISRQARTSAAIVAQLDRLLRLIDLDPMRRDELRATLGPAARFDEVIRQWAKHVDEHGFESDVVEAAVRYRIGRGLYFSGDWIGAIHQLERSLEIWQRSGAAPETSDGECLLAFAMMTSGYLERAMRHARMAMARAHAEFGERSPQYILAVICHAAAHDPRLATAERIAEQERVVSRILRMLEADPEVDFPTFIVRIIQGGLRCALGDHAGAQAALLAALEECRDAVSGRNLNLGLAQSQLAWACIDVDPKAAETWSRAGTSAMVHATGSEENDWVQSFLGGLGESLHRQGRFVEAAELRRGLLRWYLRRFGPDAPRTTRSTCQLAESLRRLDTSAARAELQELHDRIAVTGARLTHSAHFETNMALAVHDLALELAEGGRVSAAQSLVRDALRRTRGQMMEERMAAEALKSAAIELDRRAEAGEHPKKR